MKRFVQVLLGLSVVIGSGQRLEWIRQVDALKSGTFDEIKARVTVVDELLESKSLTEEEENIILEEEQANITAVSDYISALNDIYWHVPNSDLDAVDRGQREAAFRYESGLMASNRKTQKKIAKDRARKAAAGPDSFDIDATTDEHRRWVHGEKVKICIKELEVLYMRRALLFKLAEHGDFQSSQGEDLIRRYQDLLRSVKELGRSETSRNLRDFEGKLEKESGHLQQAINGWATAAPVAGTHH